MNWKRFLTALLTSSLTGFVAFLSLIVLGMGSYVCGCSAQDCQCSYWTIGIITLLVFMFCWYKSCKYKKNK